MPSAFVGCDRLPHGAFLPVPPGRSWAGLRHAWPPPGLGGEAVVFCPERPKPERVPEEKGAIPNAHVAVDVSGV